MFRSRYYKKTNHKEYTEEEKQAYKEQKEKEILKNNRITFILEKNYRNDFKKYLNIDKPILKLEFEYRADKVEAVKKLNKNERIAHYDSDMKIWIIELDKININEFKKAFSNFDIILITDTTFNVDIIRKNWTILNEIYDLCTNEKVKELKELTISMCNITDNLKNELIEEAKKIEEDKKQEKIKKDKMKTRNIIEDESIKLLKKLNSIKELKEENKKEIADYIYKELENNFKEDIEYSGYSIDSTEIFIMNYFNAFGFEYAALRRFINNEIKTFEDYKKELKNYIK